MRKQTSIVVTLSLLTLTALIGFETRSRPGPSAPVAISLPTHPMVNPTPAQPAPALVKNVQSPAPATPLPAAVVTQIDTDGAMKHVAQPGETVTSLADDLLGKNSKTNREAIINANASLKTDPDKLVAGETYNIPARTNKQTEESVLTVLKSVPKANPVVTATPAVPADHVLKYTAVPGDTVGKMAAAFLGSDDQTHQNAIRGANASLQADPDHVEVGRVYRIPAPDGLSASVGTSPVATTSRPPAQQDADEMVAEEALRTLKYTACEGDTLNKIAIALLGSDNQENRDLILSKNADLRKNPDRVVAGQTYWIPAPTAALDAR